MNTISNKRGRNVLLFGGRGLRSFVKPADSEKIIRWIVVLRQIAGQVNACSRLLVPNIHSDAYMCQGLNSHYFHLVGDGHQPNSKGFYHEKDSY